MPRSLAASLVHLAWANPASRPRLLAAVLKLAADKWPLPSNFLSQRFPKPKRGEAIESKTPILPWIVADKVLEDYAPLDEARRVAEAFGAYANHLYVTDLRFMQRVNANGNAGRDFLYAVMGQWAKALFPKPR